MEAPVTSRLKFHMDIRISAKHRRAIERQIKSGHATSPEEVVDRAMTMFTSYQRKLAALRKDVQQGIESLDRDEGKAVRSKAEHRAFFSKIMEQAKAQRRPKRGAA